MQQSKCNAELNKAIVSFTYFIYEADTVCAGWPLIGVSMENHMETSPNNFKLLCIICTHFLH